MAKAKTISKNDYRRRANNFDRAGDAAGYGPLSSREFDEEDSSDSGLVERYGLTGDDAANIGGESAEQAAARGAAPLTDRRKATAKGYRAKRIK